MDIHQQGVTAMKVMDAKRASDSIAQRLRQLFVDQAEAIAPRMVGFQYFAIGQEFKSQVGRVPDKLHKIEVFAKSRLGMSGLDDERDIAGDALGKASGDSIPETIIKDPDSHDLHQDQGRHEDQHRATEEGLRQEALEIRPLLFGRVFRCRCRCQSSLSPA